jgi:hypothetical protein
MGTDHGVISVTADFGNQGRDFGRRFQTGSDGRFPLTGSQRSAKGIDTKSPTRISGTTSQPPG